MRQKNKKHSHNWRWVENFRNCPLEPFPLLSPCALRRGSFAQTKTGIELRRTVVPGSAGHLYLHNSLCRRHSRNQPVVPLRSTTGTVAIFISSPGGATDHALSVTPPGLERGAPQFRWWSGAEPPANIQCPSGTKASPDLCRNKWRTRPRVRGLRRRLFQRNRSFHQPRARGRARSQSPMLFFHFFRTPSKTRR